MSALKTPILAAATLVAALSASAAEINITSSADATIRSDQPDTNLGTNAQLIGGSLGNPGSLNFLMSFDLSSLYSAAGANAITINSVSLQLHTSSAGQNASGALPILALNNYGFSFTEGSATWNAPATGDSTAGGTLGTQLQTLATTSSAGGQTLSFGTSTAFVSNLQTIVNSSLGTARYLVNETGSRTDNGFLRFDSKEAVGSVTGAIAPTLIIDYTVVPEPSTYGLLGAAALAGVAMVRRRRKVR